MQYHKLVRDKVPEILEKKGKIVTYRPAKQKELKKLLRDKLKEEIQEYLRDGSPEELVDPLEIIYCLAEIDGISHKKLEKLRKEKAMDRGSFEEGIILEDIKEED